MDKTNSAPPTLLVIFGISGDLARRYLLPALTEVHLAGQLPGDFSVLGLSRRNLQNSELFITPKLKTLAKRIKFNLMQMDMTSPDDFRILSKEIRTHQAKQIIFYFAVPPEGVQSIISQLGEAGLNTADIKLLMEKPFGIDLNSAKKVIDEVAEYFKEEQVYRIDHYLAKEVVQNISVFLGGNVLFRDVWSNKYISSVDVIVAEKIAIEGRAKFYEQTGALRDIVQNHALQMAALTIADPCSSVFEFEELPAHRLKALKSFSLASSVEKSAFRAQYKGYRTEVENPHSSTETFAAIKINSSLPKWKGIPINIITGKNLDAKSTKIQVNFKKTHEAQANKLIIRIQPHEGIELDLWVKEPGYERKLKKLKLAFDYDHHFNTRLPDAYEQVLLEAIRSNQHLFASSQEVLEAWRILQPVLANWSKSPAKELCIYEPGSKYQQIIAGWG